MRRGRLIFAVAAACAAVVLPASAPAKVPTAELTPGGRAIAPPSAPPAVKQMIAAANHIRHRPYRWGGGHRDWNSRGYDCSGSVSYVLHAAGLLDSPLDSTGFMRWGGGGAGQLGPHLRQSRPRLRGDRRPALGHLDDRRRRSLRPRLERGDALRAAVSACDTPWACSRASRSQATDARDKPGPAEPCTAVQRHRDRLCH